MQNEGNNYRNNQTGSNIRYFPQSRQFSGNRTNVPHYTPYRESVHRMHTIQPGMSHADYPGNVREFPSSAVMDSFARSESREDAREQKSADRIAMGILAAIVLCGIFLPMILG